ncbi:MAG TPA: hypothetical protein VKH46_14730 [Thermoanaerobaculia bacterium]|jgi:hypothetical protein|nr:hypothetical protein [Thermoanaerobaculia bacterium]
MKHRILLSAGAIAAFAAFAGAQEIPAPAAPDRDSSVTTQRQSTQTTTTEKAAPADVSSSSETSTSATSVSGTVRTYEAGKSVTIVRPDGTTVTYMINPASQLPSDVAVGRKVTVTTTTVSGSPQPVVQRMTYSTKTSTTTKSVEPPH